MGHLKSSVKRICGQLGCTTTCPPAMIANGCTLFYFCLTLSTTVDSSNLNWHIYVDFMQQVHRKAGLLEVPWLRAAIKSDQVKPEALSLHFMEFLYRLLEKNPTVTPDVYYHKLAHVGDKYRSHNDKTAKSCAYVHQLNETAFSHFCLHSKITR